MGWFSRKEKSADIDAPDKGSKVAFFHGRRPMLGTVEEIQDDGRVVVIVKSGDGAVRILKDADEVRPYSEVRGKKAKIRFLG